MKRIYTFLAAIIFATLMYADPIPGCIEPDSVVYEYQYCSSKDTVHLRHGGQLFHIFRPEVSGIFTYMDTIKKTEGVCDSLIIGWKITVRPSYVIEIPIYIPIGKTSIVWGRDNLEHKEGDVIQDSLQSTEGCDSIQIYRFIKETASGYCGAEGDGTNLAWYITEDSILIISGSGAMANFIHRADAPWYDYRYAIKEIYFPEELTSIGNYAFYDCYNLLTVSIPPAVTSIGSDAFDECWKLYYVNTPSLEAWCNINFADTAANPTCMSHKLYLDGPQIEYLVIPPTITTIKDNAFVRCDFKKVTLHANVTSIGFMAFENCNEMDTMVCYATTPPELTYGHLGYLLNTVLSVPQASVEAYLAIDGYKNSFKEITGFSEVTDITATTAKIEWIPNPDVTQYIISVYTSDTLFAQYIVDGEGNVTDTVKSAMVAKIRKKKLDSRETFTISIGGLTANTTYSYSIEGRDEQQQTIYHEEGHFQTADMDEGLFDFIATEQEQVRKTVMDGKMVILRGDHVFDVQGKMVK